MKRYVKEIHSDLKRQLIKLGSERSEEYLMAALEMDKILNLADRGLLTDKEAVSSLITCYDDVYYNTNVIVGR